MRRERPGYSSFVSPRLPPGQRVVVVGGGASPLSEPSQPLATRSTQLPKHRPSHGSVGSEVLLLSGRHHKDGDCCYHHYHDHHILILILLLLLIIIIVIILLLLLLMIIIVIIIILLLSVTYPQEAYR
jgi:hypothetical protein